MNRHDQIIAAASSLLGVSLIIITGLQVAHRTETIADEIAWVAAVCFCASIMAATLGLRSGGASRRYEVFADNAFLLGTATVFAAVLIFAVRSA